MLPPPPSPATLETKQTFTVFVGGIIVGPGDVLATDTGGSIPLELFGSLVVADATVVSDMFA